jgi:tetratricopeptide (TPR) repeat protein
MTDRKKLSGDDSERFILPDGEFITREQMEAMLKKKAESYLDMGRLSEQAGNYEDAVRHYSQAFTMPEGSDRTWYFLNNNLGYSLDRLERYAEAEACCRRAIAINPFKANAHKNLGLSLRGQGRFLDAATSFLIASMSCPGDGRAMNHLGEMLVDHPELRQEIFETLRDRLEAQGSAPKRDRSRKRQITN